MIKIFLFILMIKFTSILSLCHLVDKYHVVCFCQVKTKKNILFLQRKSITKSLTFRDAFQLPVTFLLCYAPAGVSFISGISAGLITFRFSGISSEKKMSSVFQIISTLSAP